MNAVGTAGRTVAEVKDKWKNLHSTAKKEFATFKRETKKIASGPAPKPPSTSSGKIIEVFKDTPAFSGLNEFETGKEAATPSENASTISCDFDCEIEDGELAVVKERKRRKVNCSQDDVLGMQYECLSLKRANLSLKKKKLELQVHLLQRQVDE